MARHCHRAHAKRRRLSELAGRFHHPQGSIFVCELARVYVRDALKRWVPGAQLVSLAVKQDGPALTLRVRVRERETTAAVDVSLER